MSTKVARAFSGLITCGLMGGCASAQRAGQAAAEYQEQANAGFSDAELKLTLRQSLAARFPAEMAAERKAFSDQKRLVGAKLLGSMDFGVPKKPTVPIERVWVSLAIDTAGNIVYIAVSPDKDRTLSEPRIAVVTRIVQQWKFSPETADGVPLTDLRVIPVFTDGVNVFVAKRADLN